MYKFISSPSLPSSELNYLEILADHIALKAKSEPELETHVRMLCALKNCLSIRGEDKSNIALNDFSRQGTLTYESTKSTVLAWALCDLPRTRSAPSEGARAPCMGFGPYAARWRVEPGLYKGCKSAQKVYIGDIAVRFVGPSKRIRGEIESLRGYGDKSFSPRVLLVRLERSKKCIQGS